MEYTAIVKKTKSGHYIAQCEQLPAALTQGDTEEEALENLQDAIDLILKTEKEETQKSSKGSKFIQRKIAIL
jgi:predicted RNase H-like HicB family nuclease